MQIIDVSPTGERFSVVAIEHEGKTIPWDLKYYDKQAGLEVENVFWPLNAYWSLLPKNRQKALFGVYAKVREALDTMVDHNMLHLRMTQYAKELYSLMPYDEISGWAQKHARIRVPPAVTDTYEELEIAERNQNGTDYKTMTYLREDYVGLVKLSIALKPMIPIWAEYAKVLEKISTNTSFREYQAMSILGQTELFSIEPMQRFRKYVEVSAPKDGTALSAALGGLGSSEVPDWFMSSVIIRKLVLTDVSTVDTNNLVSIVYRYVSQITRQLEKRFSGHIKRKPKPGGGEDDENKSIVETYKVRQPISDGDLMVLSIYSENTLGMAQRVCAEVTPESVKQTALTAKALEQVQPTQGQLTLLRWVLANAIPPQSIDNINKTSLLSCFAAGQAVLWAWGFYDLALLLTATETRSADGGLIGGAEFQGRIPKEYVNKFMDLYPYYQAQGSKKERQTNVACKAIDKVAREFVKCDWHVHAPEDLMALSDNVEDRGVMFVPSDIRVQLSKLVVKLVEEQETIHV